MAATTGANGGFCESCSTIIGFGFDNPKFSDRVLKIQVTPDSLESEVGKCTKSEEESQHKESSPSNGVKTVHVSSLILASQSPFFHKESEQQAVTLSVKASEESTLLNLLQFFYGKVTNASTPADLFKLLVLADRYQVAACVTHCARTLSSLPMTFELALSCQNLPSTVLEGDNAQLCSLIGAAKRFLSKNFSMHYEYALELSLESIEKILSWDTLEVESEDEVYDFVLSWAEIHYKDLGQRRQVFSSRLCQLIRFPYISSEKLKTLLFCKDLEQADASKMVLGALLSKLENQPAHAVAASQCGRRPDKLSPVVELDSAFQKYTVHGKLGKKECSTLRNDYAAIHIQKFCVGKESFNLEFLRLTGRLGVSLRWYPSPDCTADDLNVRLLIEAKLKSTGKFEEEMTGSYTLQGEIGRWFSIGGSWDSLMVEDSQYFDNGVLHIRFTVAIEQ